MGNKCKNCMNNSSDPMLLYCLIRCSSMDNTVSFTPPRPTSEPGMLMDYWIVKAYKCHPSKYQKNCMCHSGKYQTHRWARKHPPPLFGYFPARNHLKSRTCLLTSVQPLQFPPKIVRCNAWQRRRSHKSRYHTPTQRLSQGTWHFLGHMEMLH